LLARALDKGFPLDNSGPVTVVFATNDPPEFDDETDQ